MARSKGGLGIGLTLVKRLVELHGGRVEAASSGVGLGSEFVVRLPVLPTPVAPKPDVRRKGLRAPVTPRRILVVDDNVDSANSLSTVLRLTGHQVHTAHTGPAALQAARSWPPDVVLLDIGLPGMNGYEVARCLRSEKGLNGVVLLALTGYGQEDDRRKGKEAGFNHHFVKPVDLDALGKLLAELPPNMAHDSDRNENVVPHFAGVKSAASSRPDSETTF